MMNKVRVVNAKAVQNFSSADALSDQFFVFDSYSDAVKGFNRLVATDFPVRLDVFISIICEGGYLNIRIGYTNYTVRKNDFILIYPDRVFQVLEVSEDFKAKISCIKDGFFNFNNDQDSFNIRNILKEYPCHSLPSSKMELFSFLFTYIQGIVQDKNNIYRKQIVHSHLRLMLYEISNLLIDETEKKKTLSHNEEVFRKFMKEVELNFRIERNVGFYANKVHLTPKYFSTMIFKLTGKHAKVWIDEYVILETKAMLKSSYVNIQQLSYELNFATPSHFGRYFKHHTGISPRQYRNE